MMVFVGHKGSSDNVHHLMMLFIVSLAFCMLCCCDMPDAGSGIPYSYLERCSDITDDAEKEICIIHAARENGHMTFCDQAKIDNKQYCYSYFADEFHNHNFCSKLDQNRDNCFNSVAIWSQDPAICDSIIHSCKRASCKRALGQDAQC